MNQSARPNIPGWSELRKVFTFEGSGREIVIDPADTAGWQSVINYAAEQEIRGTVTTAWRPHQMPGAAAALTAAAGGVQVSMSIIVEGALLNAYFSDPTVIEFNMDPRQVTSRKVGYAILNFMEGVARAVGSEIHLTPESQHDVPWLSFNPASAMWQFFDLSDDDDEGPWRFLHPEVAN